MWLYCCPSAPLHPGGPLRACALGPAACPLPARLPSAVPPRSSSNHQFLPGSECEITRRSSCSLIMVLDTTRHFEGQLPPPSRRLFHTGSLRRWDLASGSICRVAFVPITWAIELLWNGIEKKRLGSTFPSTLLSIIHPCHVQHGEENGEAHNVAQRD